MARSDKLCQQSIAVKLCIWSIRHQAWLASQIRMYIFGATGLIAFLAFADVISIQTAMMSSFCGGAILLGLIWTLVHQRKAVLLNIQEPEVRDQAHNAMLDYLHQVNYGRGQPLYHKGLQRDHQGECKTCNLP